MMRKRLTINLFIIFMALFTCARAEVQPWEVYKSQHFIIYHQAAPEEFLDELVLKAEDYYNTILDDFGYRRFDFWSWDRRAKIYLYQNADDFHRETQQSSWAAGAVSVSSRQIMTFVGQQHFFDSILPHEMAHIIFREFVGDKTALPLWIEEGVASLEEKPSIRWRMLVAKRLVEENRYIGLEDLSGISDLKAVTPDIFYSEAASLLVFLIRSRGKEDFLDFSRRLRDGLDWRTALSKTYNFRSLQEMEEEWKGFMLSAKDL